ncbi:Metallo-dependent phosphatase-like [Phytophthora cactorum]|nr:Metallo-dependent phosphatase-like [Phytophthora cactorum]
MVAPHHYPLLLLPALLAAFALAEKPPLNYRYAGTLRDSLDRDPRPIVHIEDNVWDVNRDDEAGFLQELGSVTLTATPPLLRDGEDLVVSFSGVKRPHQTDFVGISCGPKAHDKDFLVKIGITEANGPGADGPELPNFIRFSSLYMMRCNYTVEYFNFQSKGNLEVGMVEAFTAPKHGHIAFTENVDEMSVMFNSASRETPVVKYGLDPATLNKHTEGKSKTYTDAHLCNRPANLTSQQWFRDPGNMHTVILKELKLGTRYFYKFGSDKDGWSSVYSFMSRPDESVKSAKFIAYADMGVDPAPAATSTAVRSYQDVMDGYDSFLLHFGDISYARGHAHMWDEFFHVIEPYATRVPYMVSIGNHEYDYVTGGANDPSGATGEDGRMDFHPDWANYGEDSSGECSVPMFYRWDAPANGNGIYWYSFDYGGIHVIQISSEHDWRRGSKQYKWLENDLKNVDRKKTPWVVLTSHRMMYTTQLGEEADYKVAQHFRDEVEDLLWTHKVNLMLVGHQHSYERSCAVRNGKCTEDGKGPVHIVIGSAGAGLEKQGFSNKLGEWSVSHLNDWGYLRIDSTEDSMSVQFILNRNGVVYDEVTLTPWN